MSLNDGQLQELLAPLSPGRVRVRDGNSNLEAWDDRRWLLRIFGWGGFDIETRECEVVSERSVYTDEKDLKGRHTVVYRAQVRLTIKDTTGTVLAVFDDGACGDGINQPSLLKAHDFAMKTALSQALKRCCVNLGDQFGLSLYDGGRSGVTTVGRSLAHAVTTEHPVSEDVSAGEMDEVPSDSPQPETEHSAEVMAAPPPVPEGLDSPSPSAQDMEVALRQSVDTLRERVLAAMQEPQRQKALQALTRINLDASKAGLMQQMTSMPAGEHVSVAVLIDNAVKAKSRATATEQVAAVLDEVAS